MNDILTRLRYIQNDCVQYSLGSDIIREAADEIEVLQEERDQLKAHYNQLRTALKAMNSHLNYIPTLDLTVEQVLIISPNQSLASHDAEVIERACDHLERKARDDGYFTIDPTHLYEYANQLRQQKIDEKD